MDKNNQVVEEIRKPFFKDFQQLVDAFELPYLGKRAGLIGKLFRGKL